MQNVLKSMKFKFWKYLKKWRKEEISKLSCNARIQKKKLEIFGKLQLSVMMRKYFIL